MEVKQDADTILPSPGDSAKEVSCLISSSSAIVRQCSRPGDLRKKRLAFHCLDCPVAHSNSAHKPGPTLGIANPPNIIQTSCSNLCEVLFGLKGLSQVRECIGQLTMKVS
jgi:hypothetical protein